MPKNSVTVTKQADIKAWLNQRAKQRGKYQIRKLPGGWHIANPGSFPYVRTCTSWRVAMQEVKQTHRLINRRCNYHQCYRKQISGSELGFCPTHEQQAKTMLRSHTLQPKRHKAWTTQGSLK